jgi:hypothetical protein
LLRFSTAKDRRTRFSSYDFQAVLLKEGWKNSNNNWHHHISRPSTHRYSCEAVHSIVDRLFRDAEYLSRARASLANKQQRSERKLDKIGPSERVVVGPAQEGFKLT